MEQQDAMLVVTCECGHNMKVPAGAMGKACKCVKCAVRIVISADNTRPMQMGPMQMGTMQTGPTPGDATKAPSATPPSAPSPGTRQAKNAGDTRVGQLLIEAGVITALQLNEALTRQHEQGGRLFEVLISLGHLQKDVLHTFLSKQSGVPSIDLKNYEIPRDLISLVPREIAQQHVVLPIDKLGRLLTVGMACPLDTATISALEQSTGLKVKAMLCKFDDINVAIKNYYPMERGEEEEVQFKALPAAKAPSAPVSVKSELPPTTPTPAPAAPSMQAVVRFKTPTITYEKLMAGIEALDLLPMAPRTLKRFLDPASRPSTVRDAAGLAGSDPALAARLLSLANTSAYDFPGTVTNVNFATVLLGCEGVRLVAETFRDVAVPPSFDHHVFWTRSLFCAAAAMSIAKSCGTITIPDAYSIGLLHEIGRLGLATAFPEASAEAAIKAKEGNTEQQMQAEDEVFGFTHPEVGYLLAKQWRLPENIANAIRYHHQPVRAGETKGLLEVVLIASAMLEIRDTQRGPETEPFAPFKNVLTTLGLDEKEAWRILQKTAETIKV